MKKKMGFLRVFSLVGAILFTVLYAAHQLSPVLGVNIDVLSLIPFIDQHGDVPGALMAMAVIAPFPVDQKLTSVALMYKNKNLIADRVFPYSPVGSQSFKYRKYAKGTFLTRPETLVGRTGAPNRVEIGYTEEPGLTNDYALDDPVPLVDLENAPAGYDPKSSAVEFLTQLLMLDREVRAATLAFDADNYASDNKTTLSGTSQFSHASSTPIVTIQTAIDACFYKPNSVALGREVASVLFRHADIVKAVNGTSGDKGVVRRQQFAELFELEEVLIGEGRLNIAKPGQTPVVQRVWGKSMLFFYSDPSATTRNGTTYGLTARFGGRIAGEVEDQDIGMRGGVRVRSGESVKELILANDLGYLISEAIA